MSDEKQLDQAANNIFHEIKYWTIYSFASTLLIMIIALPVVYFTLLATGFWEWFGPISWNFLTGDVALIGKILIVFSVAYLFYAPIYFLSLYPSILILNNRMGSIFRSFKNDKMLVSAAKQRLYQDHLLSDIVGIHTYREDGRYRGVSITPRPWIIGGIIVIIHLLIIIFLLLALISDPETISLLREQGII